MLSFVFRETNLTAVDPDPEKILVAENSFSKTGRVNFISQNLSEISPETADVYFLNDSTHADPLHYFQEYAPVVVTTRTETPTGWLCAGYQIESLTVNVSDGTPLPDLLFDLGNPEKDCGKNAVTFRLERGEQHTCANCM